MLSQHPPPRSCPPRPRVPGKVSPEFHPDIIVCFRSMVVNSPVCFMFMCSMISSSFWSSVSCLLAESHTVLRLPPSFLLSLDEHNFVCPSSLHAVFHSSDDDVFPQIPDVISIELKVSFFCTVEGAVAPRCFSHLGRWVRQRARQRCCLLQRRSFWRRRSSVPETSRAQPSLAFSWAPTGNALPPCMLSFSCNVKHSSATLASRFLEKKKVCGSTISHQKQKPTEDPPHSQAKSEQAQKEQKQGRTHSLHTTVNSDTQTNPPLLNFSQSHLKEIHSKRGTNHCHPFLFSLRQACCGHLPHCSTFSKKKKRSFSSRFL